MEDDIHLSWPALISWALDTEVLEPQCKYLQRLPDSGKKEQASKVNEPLHPLIKGNAQEFSVLRGVSVCCGTIFCWGCLLLNAT